MPISVTCPSCSNSFSVKDEYAGKRAKCPKCAEPLTIPDGAAPTPAARPKSSPIAKALDAEADEPVSPKRKRGAGHDDEDADDNPRPKKRRDDDEDADEKPRAKKKRVDDEDDDRPRKKGKGGGGPAKKKGSALPLILGIVVGVLALCCGTPLGLWFFWIKPAGEKFVNDVEAEASRLKAQSNPPPAVRPAEQPPAVAMTVTDFLRQPEAQRKQYDQKWVQLTGKVPSVRENTYPNKPADGWIELGTARFSSLTCSFGPDEWAKKPKFDDDKEYTVLGLFDAKSAGHSLSWCRVVGESGGATPVAVAALLSDLVKHAGRLVEVSGVIKAAGPLPLGGEAVLVEGGNGLSLKMTFNPLLWEKHKLAAGGTITARGTVSAVPTGGFAFMTVSTIQVYTPGTGNPPPVNPPTDPNGPVVTTDNQMIDRFIADITSPDRMYKGKQVKLTGRVTDLSGIDVFFGGKEADKYVYQVQVKMAAPPAFKKGDTVTLVAKYLEYTSSLQYGTRTITLTEGKVDGVAPSGALTVADVLKDHAKYTGKQITVRGKLKLVIEEVSGDRGSVTFEPSSGNLTLHAVFPAGKWRKDFLRGGEDTIEVKGTVFGQTGNPGTGLLIEVRDCDLLKRFGKDGKEVPLPPVTPAAKSAAVTAETLAAEFAKDMDAAARKYTDKTITVTGTVEKLQPTGTRVTLKGVAADGNKKAYVVEVGMNLAARDEAKKLKEGDVVKLTGKYSQFRPSGTTTPNTVLLSNGVVEK